MKSLTTITLTLCTLIYNGTTQGMFQRALCTTRSTTPSIMSHKRFCTSHQHRPTTIAISEKCYKKIEAIKQDAACLKYYFEGTFSALAEKNDPQHKPSDIINWLKSNPTIDQKTDLHIAPATCYIALFIQDKNAEFDAVFAKKYEETQSVTATWKWFNGYFEENGIRKPISAHI